jgi:hypothetical protein
MYQVLCLLVCMNGMKKILNQEPESVTPERRSAQAIDSSLLAKNWGEPMGAPAIFEKQIEIRLLHSASTEGVTDSGKRLKMTEKIFFRGLRSGESKEVTEKNKAFKPFGNRPEIPGLNAQRNWLFNTNQTHQRV